MQIEVRKGLDLPLAGRPDQKITDDKPVGSVALVLADYIGLRPKLQVDQGERVRQGQVLFADHVYPEIKFTAPVSGIVSILNYGARRRLQSVVIEQEGDVDDRQAFDFTSSDLLGTLGRQSICRTLLDSGMWTAFRTRPFGRVPAPESVPDAIFVTAIDTNPLAADPSLVVHAGAAQFVDGIKVIRQLTRGKVFVCTGSGSFPQIPLDDQVRRISFAGPHPAGLAGTHIHFLAPVHSGRVVWHLNYQDVIAIGRLFTSGHLDSMRVVSLAGGQVQRPRLLRVPLGASIDDLLVGELDQHPCRVVSGSVLSGRRAAGSSAYLGRYHMQVSVLAESKRRDFLGWLAPGREKFSASRLFLSSLAPRRRFALTTSQNGSPRAMVPIGSFEKVMPLDLLVTPLLKALLVNDQETAQQLGCLELEEEDLALCSFVCCSKYDYGEALRETLTSIEQTG